MIEIKNDLVKEFKAGENSDIFYVYIFDKDDAWEVYLQKETYGVIKMLVGLPKHFTTLEEVEDYIKATINEYKKMYEEEVCIDERGADYE